MVYIVASYGIVIDIDLAWFIWLFTKFTSIDCRFWYMSTCSHLHVFEIVVLNISWEFVWETHGAHAIVEMRAEAMEWMSKYMPNNIQ